MRTYILSSGSKGNATLFESRARGSLFSAANTTRVLVDAGLSRKAFKARLQAFGQADRLDAIVVTHAHSDHVGQCEQFAAHYQVPLYMSEATARASGIAASHVFRPHDTLRIGDLSIATLPLPHDAAQVALVVTDGVQRVALCTDLGEVPPALPRFIHGCDVLLLEANHDLQMLREGPYPEHTKRRIASARGHLSNVQCAELLDEVGPSVREIVLMHLSLTNNHPSIALSESRRALRAHVLPLRVADQDVPSLIEASVHNRVKAVARPRQSTASKSMQLSLAFG